MPLFPEFGIVLPHQFSYLPIILQRLPQQNPHWHTIVHILLVLQYPQGKQPSLRFLTHGHIASPLQRHIALRLQDRRPGLLKLRPVQYLCSTKYAAIVDIRIPHRVGQIGFECQILFPQFYLLPQKSPLTVEISCSIQIVCEIKARICLDFPNGKR